MPKKRDYLEPYEQAVAQMGPGFDALLWRSERAQVLRFDALIRLAHPKGHTIADMGCGLADLAKWLHIRSLSVKRYLGVEGVPELAHKANETLAGLALPAEVLTIDFVGEPEVFRALCEIRGVTCLLFSGSLNTLKQKQAEKVLDRAWHALAKHAGSGGTLAFNFLSDRNHGNRAGPTGPAHRYDTHRMLGWALDRTPLVSFDQAYLEGHDATIAMVVV